MKFRFLTKITIAFVFIICFANKLSAQNKYSNKQQSENKINTNVQVVDKQTKKAIRDTLFLQYFKKYKNELMDYGAHHLVVDSSNGSIKLRYFDANNEPSFAPETIIPAYKDFIEGDLNNDSCNDLIVSVYYNQGSRPRLDIYCYITKNKKLQYFEKHTIHSLGICGTISDTTGRFFPAKIENGKLVGETQCLKAGDPGCCPSLELITYFKFEDGFKFVRQEPKKKTK